MCGHEIKWKDGIFIKDMFQERHFSRDSCEGSLTRWCLPTRSALEDSMGIYDKNLVQNSKDDFKEDDYEKGCADGEKSDPEPVDALQEKPPTTGICHLEGG